MSVNGSTGLLDWIDSISDHRLDSFPFVKQPLHVIYLLASYFLIVHLIGPIWMKNRQPYKIRKLIEYYNVLQVIGNLYLTIYAYHKTYYMEEYSYICQPCNYENTPVEYARVLGTYYYFVAKVVDLLDTIFFVLTKKFSHISFLHVYHHSLMILMSYMAVKMYPAGHSTMLGILNSFVHFVMYFYYFLSARFPQNQIIREWKKGVTIIQMLQFIYLIFHFAMGFIVNCGFPQWLCLLGVSQNSIMLILFSRFYKKAYGKKVVVQKTN